MLQELGGKFGEMGTDKRKEEEMEKRCACMCRQK